MRYEGSGGLMVIFASRLSAFETVALAIETPASPSLLLSYP